MSACPDTIHHNLLLRQGISTVIQRRVDQNNNSNAEGTRGHGQSGTIQQSTRDGTERTYHTTMQTSRQRREWAGEDLHRQCREGRRSQHPVFSSEPSPRMSSSRDGASGNRRTCSLLGSRPRLLDQLYPTASAVVFDCSVPFSDCSVPFSDCSDSWFRLLLTFFPLLCAFFRLRWQSFLIAQ